MMGMIKKNKKLNSQTLKHKNRRWSGAGKRD